jgi:hypothetical protein
MNWRDFTLRRHTAWQRPVAAIAVDIQPDIRAAPASAVAIKVRVAIVLWILCIGNSPGRGCFAALHDRPMPA